MKKLNVVAGILIFNNKILCMQRNLNKFDYISYKFEFPGGKVEQGESKSQALMRELKEEMDILTNITEDNYFMTVEHQYPDFFITMHSYICMVKSQHFVMKEHVSFKWLKKEELLSLDWAPADRPIVEKLMQI